MLLLDISYTLIYWYYVTAQIYAHMDIHTDVHTDIHAHTYIHTHTQSMYLNLIAPVPGGGAIHSATTANFLLQSMWVAEVYIDKNSTVRLYNLLLYR